MKIVFIGAVEFSRRMLEHLLVIGGEVVGVCSSENTGFNADYADLKRLSDAHGLPYISVDNINSEMALSWIEDKQPDIIFCFGWSRLLKAPLLRLAPMGVLGFHPAALPKNRGRHPLIWALALGLDETASTFFFMDEGADSGDILSQEKLNISLEDDAESLYEKMSGLACQQLTKFLPQLKGNAYPRERQDDTMANLWRKRGVMDGQIDWRMSAKSIYNLVRSLTRPYVGSHFLHKGEVVKLWKVTVIDNASQNIEPGKVIGFFNANMTSPVIKCGEGAVALLQCTPSLRLNIGDYL